MASYASVGRLEEISAATRKSQTGDEQSLRIQLAAAYRMVEHFGWTQTIYGHLTVRLPGPEKHFLINPFGLMFDEVTASNLVKIDLDGTIVEASVHPVNPAGFVIHSAIHDAREDVRCIMHTHTREGMAIAALKDGFNACDFAGASLHDRVAYHDFEGLTTRYDERARLVESIGDKNFLVLRNHGLLSCGGSIAEAFANLHTMQIAAEVQVAAHAFGAAVPEPPPDVRETHATDLESGAQCDLVFDALMRRMDRIDPAFRN